MMGPILCDDFTTTVELYSTFIKHMKAENIQINVSEVSFDSKQKEGARTHTGGEVPLGSQMSPMQKLMTVSLRNMSTMP
jgi:hypothetical protein